LRKKNTLEGDRLEPSLHEGGKTWGVPTPVPESQKGVRTVIAKERKAGEEKNLKKGKRERKRGGNIEKTLSGNTETKNHLFHQA